MGTIKDTLPRAYHALLPVFFDLSIPDESHATCADCAMIEHTIDGPGSFNEATKCCTFFPVLPNYLVGGILNDEREVMAEGRKRIRAAIKEQRGVYPHGIYPPRIDRYLYEIGRHKGFGQSASLRCPYYNDRAGGCSIWEYRNAICSTWYCRYQAGFLGERFWQGVKEYLEDLEANLYRYAMSRLGIDSGVIIGEPYLKIDPGRGKPTFFPDAGDLDRTPPSREASEQLWGKWDGDQEGFYRRCHAEIGAAAGPALARDLMGFEENYRIDDLRQRLDRMLSSDVPLRLRRGDRVAVHYVDDGDCVLAVATCRYRTDRSLARALEYFDGYRPVADVIAELKEREQIELDSDLVRELYLQQYLVEA